MTKEVVSLVLTIFLSFGIPNKQTLVTLNHTFAWLASRMGEWAARQQEAGWMTDRCSVYVGQVSLNTSRQWRRRSCRARP